MSDNRPHVHPEDLLYHEEIAALMRSIHIARHKAGRQFYYGHVSYLKLIDEGKIQKPSDERVLRDLEVYREAARRHATLLAAGGER